MNPRTELTTEPTPFHLADRLVQQSRPIFEAICADLAAQSGGHCGVVAITLAALAAEELFMRRVLLSVADFAGARKSGDSAAKHLAAAMEAAARAPRCSS